ncbi:MAG: hypothetical protein H6711_12110 [Myxococcales bacterium]|nr:hypothetical protein [Myxococcales bacterium]
MLGRRGFIGGSAVVLSLGPSRARASAPLPFVAGEVGFSGEAALAMALATSGARIDPAAIFAASGVDPGEGRGARADELSRAAEALGASASLWVAEVHGDAASGLWSALQELRSGSDALVIELGDGTFAAVVGLAGAKLELHHPLQGPSLRWRRRELAARWPKREGGEAKVRAVALRLPRALEIGAVDPRRLSPILLARRAREIAVAHAGRGWSVAAAAPCVVTGDLQPEALRAHVELIERSLTCLRRDFFARDPSRPVVAYLFGDDASYRRHARELFGHRPETPYGYYDASERALVMNIATGGGTLIHELVHPLLRASFPAASPWLDEGLASLFEQCHARDGHLLGLTNWRLAGLQHELRAGIAPGFAEIMAMDAGAFYGEGEASRYAVARYLLYYFQERGALVPLWRALVDGGRRADGGLAIVDAHARALGHADMAAFRRSWESFALGLHYP